MVALRMEDLKGFTAGLFMGELFDGWLVREAEIVTFNRFTIDGRIRRGIIQTGNWSRIGLRICLPGK